MGAPAKDDDNVRVLVRVRPLNSEERKRGEKEVIRCLPDGLTMQIVEGKKERDGRNTASVYKFSRCFPQELSQEEVFEDSGVKELLELALEGFSSTLFAYGQTGSGKTYSIAGDQNAIALSGTYGNNPTDGIVGRACSALFEMVDTLVCAGSEVSVEASFVEIYNEQTFDLLGKVRGRPLQVRLGNDGFFVEDLNVVLCSSACDLLNVFIKGMRRCAVASHAMNRLSSRSHCLLTCYLTVTRPDMKQKRYGKVSFVDLAGSERLKDTAGPNKTSTSKETGHINRSLFTLGKVISSLVLKKRDPVPFRESNLTKLLIDSLGGKCKCLLLACLAPTESQLHETLRTLDFANKAKLVKNKPVVLLDPQEQLIEQLRQEIRKLREENEGLKVQVRLTQSADGRMGEAIRHVNSGGDWGGGTAPLPSSLSLTTLRVGERQHEMKTLHEARPLTDGSVVAKPPAGFAPAQRLGGRPVQRARKVTSAKKKGAARKQLQYGSPMPQTHQDIWGSSGDWSHYSTGATAREDAAARELDELTRFSYFPEGGGLSSGRMIGPGGGGGGTVLAAIECRERGKENVLTRELDSLKKFSYFSAAKEQSPSRPAMPVLHSGYPGIAYPALQTVLPANRSSPARPPQQHASSPAGARRKHSAHSQSPAKRIPPPAPPSHVYSTAPPRTYVSEPLGGGGATYEQLLRELQNAQSRAKLEADTLRAKAGAWVAQLL